MSGNEIVDTVLKVAEKVASVDLEQAGKKLSHRSKTLMGQPLPMQSK